MVAAARTNHLLCEEGCRKLATNLRRTFVDEGEWPRGSVSLSALVSEQADGEVRQTGWFVAKLALRVDDKFSAVWSLRIRPNTDGTFHVTLGDRELARASAEDGASLCKLVSDAFERAIDEAFVSPADPTAPSAALARANATTRDE